MKLKVLNRMVKCKSELATLYGKMLSKQDGEKSSFEKFY
jgi:hypothetical protein